RPSLVNVRLNDDGAQEGAGCARQAGVYRPLSTIFGMPPGCACGVINRGSRDVVSFVSGGSESAATERATTAKRHSIAARSTLPLREYTSRVSEDDLCTGALIVFGWIP
ncbi:MAG TPA: hypothetical protein VGD50_04340, partial [Candidatus Baltobacteraceae bacterium]